MTGLLLVFVSFAVMGLAVGFAASWPAKAEPEPDQPERTIPVQMPAPMKAEELAAVFGSVREETPWWRAVHTLLAEDQVGAMERIADPRAVDQPGAMAHLAGGLAWCLDFRDRLRREVEQARRVETEAEK